MCLKNALDVADNQGNAEVKVFPGANGKDAPDNSSRKHIITFMRPRTVRVYIALRASPFCEIVCEWIGPVLDYYIFIFCGLEKQSLHSVPVILLM